MNRLRLAWLFLLALTVAGCAKSADHLGNEFEQLKTGMSVSEVEAQLGPGEEVAPEQLPENFKRVYGADKSLNYRRWTRESGGAKAVLYAAFKDGKLAGQRLVEKETITRN